jgi:hypothetical protein
MDNFPWMDNKFSHGWTNLAMDGLWNGVASPHDQETPDRSSISARSRKSRYETSSLVCYEVLSFLFLTLFWFYCLCCFVGWLTVYKILKFGLVYYVILSFDYGATH